MAGPVVGASPSLGVAEGRSERGHGCDVDVAETDARRVCARPCAAAGVGGAEVGFRIHAARLRRRMVTARKAVKTPEAKPAVSRYGVKKPCWLCRRTSCPRETQTALRKLTNATARKYQTANAAARREAIRASLMSEDHMGDA